MKYTIDTKVLKESHITLPEILMLMLVKTGADPPTIVSNLLSKEMITTDKTNELFPRLCITPHYNDLLSNILLDSDKDHQSDGRIITLAEKLMDVFPKGKKEGSTVYWRGNLKDTSLRLKKFFKLYGNKYTDEDILNAAQRYVDTFNQDYRFMRVLKYFIWKDEVKCIDGVNQVVETSDLASYIENANQEDEISDNWTTNLS